LEDWKIGRLEDWKIGIWNLDISKIESKSME